MPAQKACAAILWKDASRSAEAAEALKITSWDLKKLGILDDLLPEPVGPVPILRPPPLEASETLKQAPERNLDELSRLSPQELRQLRYQKFRQIGVFTETAA